MFLNIEEILSDLTSKQHEGMKKSYSKENQTYAVIGVKMQDIRALAKKIGIHHDLAIKLNDLNIYETMMLSTFIADRDQMTFDLLNKWAKRANQSSIIDQGLAHLMLQVKDYQKLLEAWCVSSDKDLKYAGFATLSGYFRLESLDQIDIHFGLNMLTDIEHTIVTEPLSIQNAMNNAVVMAGLHVPHLVEKAYEVAEKIGYILPLKARNSCNIQSALDYLNRYITQPKFSRVAKIKEAK